MEEIARELHEIGRCIVLLGIAIVFNSLTLLWKK